MSQPERFEVLIVGLMDALEHFLHRAFVLKHEIRQVKKNIPPRAVGH
jgi:hypothetical protein